MPITSQPAPADTGRAEAEADGPGAAIPLTVIETLLSEPEPIVASSPSPDDELDEILALIRNSPIPESGHPAIAAIAPPTSAPKVMREFSGAEYTQGPASLRARLGAVQPSPAPTDATAISMQRMQAVETALAVLGVRDVPNPEPPVTAAPIPAAPSSAVDVPPSIRVQAPLADIPEAEVDIVRVARPQCIPTRPAATDAMEAPAFAGAEEAAVVIIKHATGERGAGDLAFYKQSLPESEGTIRRFMDALTGPART